MKMQEIINSDLPIKRLYVITCANYYLTINNIRKALRREYETRLTWVYQDNRHNFGGDFQWRIAIYNEERSLYVMGTAFYTQDDTEIKIILDKSIYRQAPGW